MKKSKYLNKRVIVSGVKYDSIKESKRGAELKALEKSGVISGLEMQKVFELIPKQAGERSVKYIADFVYIENGKQVVEDIKSKATRKLPAYIIKRKLMLYVYGIRIKQV